MRSTFSGRESGCHRGSRESADPALSSAFRFAAGALSRLLDVTAACGSERVAWDGRLRGSRRCSCSSMSRRRCGASPPWWPARATPGGDLRDRDGGGRGACLALPLPPAWFGYRHDGTAERDGGSIEPGVPSVPIGARLQLDGDTLAPKICRSGQPERVDDYEGITVGLADRLRALRDPLRRRRADRLQRRAVGCGRHLRESRRGLSSQQQASRHSRHGLVARDARQRGGARARERVAGARGSPLGTRSGGPTSATSTTARRRRLVGIALGLRLFDFVSDDDPARTQSAALSSPSHGGARTGPCRAARAGPRPAPGRPDRPRAPRGGRGGQHSGRPCGRWRFDEGDRPSEAVEVAPWRRVGALTTWRSARSHSRAGWR